MTEWNDDMSAAPKDGTEVLLWAASFDGPYYGVFEDDGWHVADVYPGPWTKLCAQQTHWAPLPSPPKTEDAA